MIAASVALLVTLVVTPFASTLAVRWGFVDHPGLRKLHSRPIPNIGGAALMAGLLSGLAALLVLEPVLSHRFFADPTRGLAVVIACVAVFVLGIVDDRVNLRVRHKALAQILVATGLYFAGVRLDNIQFTQHASQGLGWISYPLTLVWIVGVTNAFNLIDGLDGLAGGIGLLVCAALAIMGIEYGQYLLGGMALIWIASLLGFLVYNVHPARIYLGDGGSLTLGLFVAAGSLLSLQANPRYISIGLPLLAAAVPLLDCLHCMLRRTLERRSPFSADKGHIHHLLISLGIPHARAVMVLHIVTAIATTCGILALWQEGVPRMLLLVAGFFAVAGFFWAVGYFSFRNIVTNLRQVHTIAREEKDAQKAYENLRLRIKEVTTFDEWWTTLCQAAEDLAFVCLSLPIAPREGPPHTLRWSSEYPEIHPQLLTFEVPVRQRRRNACLNAIVRIDPAQTSLELCAARFRFFARLLDEHNLLTLGSRTAARPHRSIDQVIPSAIASTA